MAFMEAVQCFLGDGIFPENVLIYARNQDVVKAINITLIIFFHD